jgi:hypothetical protein
MRSGEEDTVAASTVANQTYTAVTGRHKRSPGAHQKPGFIKLIAII